MGQCIAIEEVRKLRGESQPLRKRTCSAQRFNRKHEGHQETSKPACVPCLSVSLTFEFNSGGDRRGHWTELSVRKLNANMGQPAQIEREP
jgi:hypothetical protein